MFFFSSRRRHTRYWRDWSSDVCSSDLYYIDYTLAQVCALQFWVKCNENREKAWEDYLRLCKVGGSKSFLELIDIANLKNPFENGCIESVMKPAKQWLDSVDDSNM